MRMAPRPFLFLLVLFSTVSVFGSGYLPSAALAQLGNPVRVVDYPPDHPVRLGYGWNDSLGRPTLRSCLSATAEAQDDAGQTKDMHMKQVEDRDSLMRALEISTEVRARAIAATVTAKANFAKQVKIEGQSINLSLYARVRNPTRFVVPGKSSDRLRYPAGRGLFGEQLARQVPDVGGIITTGGEAIDLHPAMAKLATTNPQEFIKQCGTSFVSAVHSGAEVSAVFLFRSNSRSEQETLTVSLSGSGWGVHISGSLKDQTKKFSEKKQLEIHYHQSGGSGDPLPTSYDGLIAQVEDLPKLAAKDPKAYALTLHSYAILPSAPKSLTTAEIPPFEVVAKQYYRFQTVWDTIGGILAKDEAYILGGGFDTDSLEGLQDQLREKVSALAALASTCIGDPTKCKVHDDLKTSDYTYLVQLPVFKGSFDEDVARAKREKEMAALDGTIAKLEARKKKCSGLGAKNCIETLTRALNTSHAKQKQLSQAQAAALADWRTAVRAEVLDFWVRRTSKARCDIALHEPDCLSNAAIQKLLVSVPGAP